MDRRRRLLTDAERRMLFGVPMDRDELARCYTLTRSDRDLVARRRSDANRLGFAMQLALLRHAGITLAQVEEPIEVLVDWMAEHLGLPAHVFMGYASRPQTMYDHVGELATELGLRMPTVADRALMIEAAADAARATDAGVPIAKGVIASLRAARIILPAADAIERAGVAGRTVARRRAAEALLCGLSDEQIAKLDNLLNVDADLGQAPLTWLKRIPSSPTPDHVREIIDRLHAVRDVGIDRGVAVDIHENRLRQYTREGHASSANLLERYTTQRRRATLVALLIDLEARLTDAALDMSDKLIGKVFRRAKNRSEETYNASAKDVGRLMRTFAQTIDALALAQETDQDAFTVVDDMVGWANLLRIREEVANIADLAGEDPLVRAAGSYITLRKFAPALFEALEFKAARPNDPALLAVKLLKDLNKKKGRRSLPPDAPMPFRKEWRKLVLEGGKPNRRLWEVASMATVRNRLRSGDLWVDRSASYRRFDSYLMPATTAQPIATTLGIPLTADEWLAERGRLLNDRLEQFADKLKRGQLDGVELRGGGLHISPIKTTATPEAKVFANRLDNMLPRVRITELLHEVNRAVGFSSAFTNLRTGEVAENENALFAAILADGMNLGLTRMAEASQGVTRDQLVWTADAYIRSETYRAALAKLVDAHHALPISKIWGNGDTSSSDGQFFRSGKRGAGAGDVNARYGVDPGFAFYTHVSDQHSPYHVVVISAATHEAPWVLDGLLHHGSNLKIDTHYVDTGGASDHVFALCALLGFRFCPRLRDFQDRKLATIAPAGTYPELADLIGRRVKVEAIREHWDEIIRIVASLKEGAVAPSTMLKKLAAYDRQNQLDLALREVGRIERTLFMLDWLESPELRRRCQAGLNKGEQRHSLTQAICTFKQGRIADRRPQAQEYRASGLNLITAAIVYWNSTYIADAVAHLASIGEPAPAHLLAHTSPVGWEHITLSGDFLWEQAATVTAGRRALNLRGFQLAA